MYYHQLIGLNSGIKCKNSIHYFLVRGGLDGSISNSVIASINVVGVWVLISVTVWEADWVWISVWEDWVGISVVGDWVCWSIADDNFFNEADLEQLLLLVILPRKQERWKRKFERERNDFRVSR